jgi:hypothetical protein
MYKPKIGAALMHEEVLGHLDFWTQLRQYLDDHKIQIRLSGSSKSSLSDVFLPRSYFRLRPWHLLKDDQLGVSIQFNEPGALVRYALVAQQHRRKVFLHTSVLPRTQEMRKGDWRVFTGIGGLEKR